ncbi:secondary thiamine-phosphate synthase enzyme YjbQ [Desulfonatronovibrio hydrogenovorans]|uniref:secondary thiamine-phosphate synthase enzyme YjbQ n=1 Tax=Desulfonatronovibrio hydrogenovorans TaxID=53245 RepID=UPI000490A038|nr:secondary thiamine-phosphate synthase enzyme YjbQ [Desulfonatronovibrio hydrogenovorans]
MDSISVKTGHRQELADITGLLQEHVRSKGLTSGVLTVFCPHTTAGITINEGADPSVVRDILVNLEKLVPRQGDYRHREGNSDAHIKTSLIGPAVQIIVEESRLMLGTWQKVFLADFDGPRTRKVWLKFISS